jgi:CBS domain-containing protein
MKVEDVMHNGVSCVQPDAPIKEIAELMKTDDIGSVLVCENDRLAGVITDRDLVMRLLGDGSDPFQKTARDVMTKGVVYCRTNQTIEDALHLMEDKQIRRLPVINEDKRLVGMLSLGDIAHRAGRELTGELIQAVATPHR